MQPNRRGRPRKSEEDALSTTLRVRLRPAERKAIEAKARAKGQPLSTWVRLKLLHGK